MTIEGATSLISALAALGAVVLGFVNRKSIKEVHVSLNSRLSQLILASEAKGAVDERVRAESLLDDREGNGLLDKLKR